MIKYKEFVTCKCCGYIFRDYCFSCGNVLVCDENSVPIKIRCPKCGEAEKHNREKKIYLICPGCSGPLIEEANLKDENYNLSKFNYCTNCGHEVKGVLEKAHERI